MKESTPAAAVMRIFAFTTLVNRKLPTRVSTYRACKYTETKHPWLLAKTVWEHIFKILLNAIRVWLMAPCLSLFSLRPSFSYSSLYFPVCFPPTCCNTKADSFPHVCTWCCPVVMILSSSYEISYSNSLTANEWSQMSLNLQTVSLNTHWLCCVSR